MLALVVAAAGAAQDTRWPFYAGSREGHKYAPHDQITAENVGKLRIAWRLPSIDYGIAEKHEGLGAAPSLFETTPVYDGRSVLLATGLGAAAGIEPSSGELRWTYDPWDLGEKPDPASLGFRVLRGGTSWSSGGARRLLFVSNGDLVSLDAATGRPDAAFGDAGRVDLRVDPGEDRRSFFWTSPPMVCRDTIVVGNSTTDIALRKRAQKGTIRGYDVRSGALLWTFNIIPKEGEPGVETWEEGSAAYTGHGNVWTWMACDEELGTVYAPTSTPNNDWYGGHRPGKGLYAESLLCLEARTGKLLWHFQAIHHGLWDYDFPAGPILADVVVDGRPRKIVAQVSKQAFLYVFDRTNGEPIWPIVEMAVPQSTVPGEKAWPTQPFPTWPKAYDRQGISYDDLIDFTPELRAEAMELVKDFRMGPLYTPPQLVGADGLRGYLQVPSAIGGSNWNGAAYDPETHVIYIPSCTNLNGAAVHEPADPARSDIRYLLDITGTKGFTPLTIDGLPFVKPPWGRITAIDLDTGEHLWQRPNGDGPRDHPRLKDLDLPPLGHPGRGSPLVTKTLLFLADGSKDLLGVPPWAGGRFFRAYDKATGEEVGKVELPAGASGAPMSYMYGGKQYIVVPVGEREHEGELVALALPD